MPISKILALVVLMGTAAPLLSATEGPRERHKVSPDAITPHLRSDRIPAYHSYYPGHSHLGFHRYPGWFGNYYHPGNFMPAVGRSSIWMSAGSQGYLGGGFSTRQPIGDSPFVYGVAVSHEQGRTWHPDIDFRKNTISPWLEWHGENTSIYGGFSRSNIRYQGSRQ